MIPKLRKKFISITAGALFALILLVILSINCIFISQCNHMLDIRLDMLINGRHEFSPHEYNTPFDKDASFAPPDSSGKNQSGFTPTPPTDKPDNLREERKKISTFFPLLENNLHFESNGCVIYLNADGTIKSIRQNAAEEYSEAELSAIVTTILTQNKDHGWHEYFRYRRINTIASGNTAEITIGLINASQDLYSVFTMMGTSLIIGLLSFLLVLLIVTIASGKAIKPIAETYAKQKQFVTDAGHELKTPLTVISANNELARMIYGNSEWFDSTDHQIGKMNNLIRNLITLAKMDEEQAPVFVSFNLSDAVYDTAKSFQNLIHASNRLITFDIADEIFYTGDESKLRQVVSILMDNAIKYCDENGKIAIKFNADAKQIHLQVINDFSAVEDCDFSQLFERFYRADKARTADGSYGLGLSIAKSMVELHKGTIQAHALEHERVVFEVFLPRNIRK